MKRVLFICLCCVFTHAEIDYQPHGELNGDLHDDSVIIDLQGLDESFLSPLSTDLSTMSVEEFILRVEKNSINLAKSKAMVQALFYEGKAARAWHNGYIESSVDSIKSPNGGKELQTEILASITPRLPWVTYTLRQSYQNKILRGEKSYELTKRLALISAKRLYLDYLVLKEQYLIYLNRYHNTKDQLRISQVQYEAGRISKSQYLFFKSDFLSTQLALQDSYTQMLKSLKSLKVVLGMMDDNSDINIDGLHFSYLDFGIADLQKALLDNLYIEIVNLDIKDYQYSARVASSSMLDNIEIGGGVAKAESSNGILFNIKIPLPLTSKYLNQRAMYLALQSGSIRESEILKDSITINAKSYLDQLTYKKNTIALAKNNELNKKELSEIAKVGYDAGRVSAFEYLSVKNNHLTAMIMTTQAKQDYINTLSMLEETLSIVLNLNAKLDSKEK